MHAPGPPGLVCAGRLRLPKNPKKAPKSIPVAGFSLSKEEGVGGGCF
jgi:hypothetical protein